MNRNNVTLRQLRAFVLVADKGSFVAAAETLALSQPALSHSIQQLEEQIGSSLFHRTTRSVKLTGLGMGFLPTARHLLRQVDTSIADIQEAAARKRGRVVVACLPSIAFRLMPAVIAGEASRLGLRVVVRDVNLTAITTAVLDGQADLGIGSFETAAPSLDGVVIGRDRFYGAFPKSHPLAQLPEVSWADLQGHPFIAMTLEHGIRNLIDNAIAPHNVRLSIASEVSNLVTIYGLLEQGVGITALPGLALPPGEHPLLVYRPLKDPILERTIRVVWRHGIGLSPAARTIVKAISGVISDGKVLTQDEATALSAASSPAAGEPAAPKARSGPGRPPGPHTSQNAEA
jgi:DNA-binding transcriptional LysR family regulator